MLGRGLGSMALAVHESNTAHGSSGKVKKHLRKTQWPRIVMSLFPVSCVRMMTAKDHFNEMKREKKEREQGEKTTDYWRNSHVETIEEVVESSRIRDAFLFQVFL